MQRAVLVITGLLLVQGMAVVRGQDAAMVIGNQEIPRANYQSWSMFLVCTPDWVTPERSGDLANLYRRFQSFGDAIGRDNVAVWFWKRNAPLFDARLAENVDVARSADYCKALTLRPSEGPFLVVTMAYPDLKAFPKERAVFALGGLQPAELATLLNGLTDQLLIEGKVAAARSAAAPAPASSAAVGAASGFWIQLLEGARRAMIGAGCAVKLQVTTGVLSAELRGCSG
jgi:hypothetical protein